MEECHTIFVMEGATDLPLLQALLTKFCRAVKLGPLVVNFRSESTADPDRSYGYKYSIDGKVVGLRVARGKELARRATRELVGPQIQDFLPRLRNVILVRDLDTSDASALNQGLNQQLRELAMREAAEFASLGDGPWLCRVHNVAVGQILLGDASTPGNPAIEDHILELLKYQPGRDPTKLTSVVGGHLSIDLSPKQQVLLAMVKDDYWTAAAGFYERVLASASKDEELKSLADQIGFTELMQRLTDEKPEG